MNEGLLAFMLYAQYPTKNASEPEKAWSKAGRHMYVVARVIALKQLRLWICLCSRIVWKRPCWHSLLAATVWSPVCSVPKRFSKLCQQQTPEPKNLHLQENLEVLSGSLVSKFHSSSKTVRKSADRWREHTEIQSAFFRAVLEDESRASRIRFLKSTKKTLSRKLWSKLPNFEKLLNEVWKVLNEVRRNLLTFSLLQNLDYHSLA